MGMEYAEYRPGRVLMGNLPPGTDILASVAAMCRAASVRAAAFTVDGVVSSFTIGTFDPGQQVYVTARVSSPGEIVSCSGSLFSRNEKIEASARIVLADDQGAVTGGRLFSETLIFSGEVRIHEWIGPPAGGG